eukprot:scaffold1594_cov401-Prasinococcus_capsulatus_cf.AAC.17
MGARASCTRGRGACGKRVQTAVLLARVCRGSCSQKLAPVPDSLLRGWPLGAVWTSTQLRVGLFGATFVLRGSRPSASCRSKEVMASLEPDTEANAVGTRGAQTYVRAATAPERQASEHTAARPIGPS